MFYNCTINLQGVIQGYIDLPQYSVISKTLKLNFAFQLGVSAHKIKVRCIRIVLIRDDFPITWKV